MNIEHIRKKLIRLHDDAFDIYKPQVEAIFGRDASEDEVAHLLDNMLSFCGDERLLILFKQVCRKYYKKYPNTIVNQINTYREFYDTDKEVTDDQF